MSQTYEIEDRETDVLEEIVAGPREEKGPASPSKQTAESRPGRKRALLIFALVVLIAATAGISFWAHARNFEDTDDAQIDANLSPIGTRINGTITKVYVDNNQVV